MKSERDRFIIQKLWTSLLILSHVLLSYYFLGGWWISSIGSILIILFSYLIWKNDFLKVIGLTIDYKIVIKSIFLAGLVTICALLLMSYIAHKQNVIIQFRNWRDYYHDIFYILNEEIVLGAIILYFLVNKRKIKPIIASLGLAIVFSLIHFIFYKWIFNDRGIIEITTLLTLFLIGFVRNNLILYTGHIGYSWALHFGWMVVMFGSFHIYSDSMNPLSEPERFNTYLGSLEMLTLSLILALGSLIFMKRNEKRYSH
ncbi:MAG: hypothetical protein HOO91_06690 [Bacteroidales bacterium]|nr:hypothetical protein [Bacteroidales bacterium]